MIVLKSNVIDLYRQLLRIEYNLVLYKNASISFYIQKREAATHDIKRIKERIRMINKYPIISHK